MWIQIKDPEYKDGGLSDSSGWNAELNLAGYAFYSCWLSAIFRHVWIF